MLIKSANLGGTDERKIKRVEKKNDPPSLARGKRVLFYFARGISLQSEFRSRMTNFDHSKIGIRCSPPAFGYESRDMCTNTEPFTYITNVIPDTATTNGTSIPCVSIPPPAQRKSIDTKTRS